MIGRAAAVELPGKVRVERLIRSLELMDLQVEVELAAMVRDKSLEAGLRAKILMWFGDKVFPSLKSVEIDRQDNKTINVEVVSFSSLGKNVKKVMDLGCNASELMLSGDRNVGGVE